MNMWWSKDQNYGNIIMIFELKKKKLITHLFVSLENQLNKKLTYVKYPKFILIKYYQIITYQLI